MQFPGRHRYPFSIAAFNLHFFREHRGYQPKGRPRDNVVKYSEFTRNLGRHLFDQVQRPTQVWPLEAAEHTLPAAHAQIGRARVWG